MGDDFQYHPGMETQHPESTEPTQTAEVQAKPKARPSRIDLLAFFVSLIAFAFAATWPWLIVKDDPKDSGITITIEDESGRTGAEALGSAAADAAIGFASRVKERLTKSKDEESEDPEADPGDPDETEQAEEDPAPVKKAKLDVKSERSMRDYFAPGTIVLGVIGIGLGGLSMTYGTSKGLAYAAMGLGVAAVMIQILYILAAVIAGLILLALLAPVLSAFST